MPKFLEDSDGDVWEQDGGGSDAWFCDPYTVRTRGEIEQEFGPVREVPSPKSQTAPSDDLRALVAAAFEDFALRMAATWQSGSTEYNPFERCAHETADAVRTGQLTVLATHP